MAWNFSLLVTRVRGPLRGKQYVRKFDTQAELEKARAAYEKVGKGAIVSANVGVVKPAQEIQKMSKEKIKDTLRNAGVYADSVGKAKDGSFVVKKGYFYRFGSTPEKWENLVKKVFPNAKITSSRDHYAAWPSPSYFEVRFKVE